MVIFDSMILNVVRKLICERKFTKNTISDTNLMEIENTNYTIKSECRYHGKFKHILNKCCPVADLEKKLIKEKVSINGLKYCDSQICEDSGRKPVSDNHQGLYYNRDKNAGLNMYKVSYNYLFFSEINRGPYERGFYIERKRKKHKINICT